MNVSESSLTSMPSALAAAPRRRRRLSRRACALRVAQFLSWIALIICAGHPDRLCGRLRASLSTLAQWSRHPSLYRSGHGFARLGYAHSPTPAEISDRNGTLFHSAVDRGSPDRRNLVGLAHFGGCAAICRRPHLPRGGCRKSLRRRGIHRPASGCQPRRRLDLCGKAPIEVGSVIHHDSAGNPFSVTVSAGVAEKRTTDANTEMLVERADLAMYAAKAAGRNRTCTSP
jgi:hypothetical protein